MKMETTLKALEPVVLDLSPPQELTDRIEAAERAGIELQKSLAIIALRCWRAEHEGYKQVDPERVALSLCQQADKKRVRRTKDDRISIETYKQPWISRLLSNSSEIYSDDKLVSHVVIASCDQLATPMPYGVLLKMAELKESGLFDGFLAIAPSECFVRPTHDDPVIVGIIGRGPGCKYFEIARW